MRGEVHHGVHASEDRLHAGRVPKVPANEFEAFRQKFKSRRKIVEDDDLMTMFTEHTSCVTADIARTTDYENFHRSPSKQSPLPRNFFPAATYVAQA